MKIYWEKYKRLDENIVKFILHMIPTYFWVRTLKKQVESSLLQSHSYNNPYSVQTSADHLQASLPLVHQMSLNLPPHLITCLPHPPTHLSSLASSALHLPVPLPHLSPLSSTGPAGNWPARSHAHHLLLCFYLSFFIISSFVRHLLLCVSSCDNKTSQNIISFVLLLVRMIAVLMKYQCSDDRSAPHIVSVSEDHFSEDSSFNLISRFCSGEPEQQQLDSLTLSHLHHSRVKRHRHCVIDQHH